MTELRSEHTTIQLHAISPTDAEHRYLTNGNKTASKTAELRVLTAEHICTDPPGICRTRHSPTPRIPDYPDEPGHRRYICGCTSVNYLPDDIAEAVAARTRCTACGHSYIRCP
ncbi:hypothetical protein [Nocardia sp. NPDC004711]